MDHALRMLVCFLIMTTCVTAAAILEDARGYPFLSAMDNHNRRDVEALLSFRNEIKSDPFGNLYNWTARNSNDLCSWYGIRCRKYSRRVVSVDLHGSRLEGNLSPFLGNLSLLRSLNLSDNNFTGRIPPNFGLLKALATLDLGGNVLTGSIPVELGLLKRLEYLDLQDNELENTIPPSPGNCSSLKLLYLGYNLLSGSVPCQFGNLKQLTHLSISFEVLRYVSDDDERGNISGTIPSEIGNCSKLTFVDSGGNKIQRPLPMSIFRLPLSHLSLAQNRLIGNIPEAIANLTKLTDLCLSMNRLTGNVPQAIFNLTKLTGLDLSGNELNGNIPQGIAKLTESKRLDLSSNWLTDIFLGIANLCQLQKNISLYKLVHR